MNLPIETAQISCDYGSELNFIFSGDAIQATSQHISGSLGILSHPLRDVTGETEVADNDFARKIRFKQKWNKFTWKIIEGLSHTISSCEKCER